MKTFILLVSNSLLVFSGYVFFNNLKSSSETNYLIFMTLLILIILISLVISILTIFQLRLNKKRNKSLHYNSYSDRRIKDSEFDKSFTWLNF